MRDALHPKTWVGLLTEVVLIGLSVFLALVAEEWRVHWEHRQEAAATLRYFHEEMTLNRDAVDKERSYHQKLSDDIQRFLGSNGPRTKQDFFADVHFAGVHPITFERTAWDLALANQSLSYLKPSLAFDISRVYTRQQAFQTVENSFLQSALNPSAASATDATALASVLSTYLIDVNIQEPALVKLYDQVLHELDEVAPRRASNR